MVAKSLEVNGGSERMQSERRTSARIQKLNSETALRLERKKESTDRPEERIVRKKARVHQKAKVNAPNADPEDGLPDVGTEEAIGTNTTSDKGVKLIGAVGNGTVSEKSAHARVTKALRIFNKYYLQFVQGEENRCDGESSKSKTRKACKNDAKRVSKQSNSKATTKTRNSSVDDSKKGFRRPDLKAISKMVETNTILSPKTRIGHIAGVDVGHQFFSRAEMVVIGVHNHWLSGIDCIGKSGKKDYADYKLPLAVSIVMSGQYEDDLDNCEDVIYTGQGGNNLVGDKRQFRDQVMERGNLGLKNCMEQSVPVRVVRGHQCSSSYVGKLYTYDGLYKVVKYWAEKGVSGFTVYKFRLERLEGQPLLTTNQVHFSRGGVPNSLSEIRGLVCADISGGLENIPIPATNLVDEKPFAPTGFTYRKYNQIAKNVKFPKKALGCDCEGTCINTKSCACARLNGFDFPYVHRDGGRLIEPKAVIFECGPNCRCGPDCVNRTSQWGLRFRLEVFRTTRKGWAVRSWDYIPSGSPVCEYIGVVLKTDDADTSISFENNYLFEIDCLQTMKGLDGREKRLGDVSIPGLLENDNEAKLDSGPEFCIDAGSTGNVARFINHSCQPNLFVQCVLNAHHDVRLARVVLFAADNIPPLKELTYDYGYALNSVMGSDGEIRQMPCYCGASGCRGRLF